MMIVLDACEAFFLRGGDDLAVNDEAGGGVVIERRDSENTYHRKSEEGIDEWRDCRAFGKHQQHADRDERDQDRSEPELLVLPHELPQLGNDVKFRHAAQKVSPAAAQRRNACRAPGSIFFCGFRCAAAGEKFSTSFRNAADLFASPDTAPKKNRELRLGVATDPSPSRASPNQLASAPKRTQLRGLCGWRRTPFPPQA